ncbi:AsmA family protein [Legionella lansingensis]|nr:AsmA family protein [Legionella lansingensis]
MKFLKRLVFTFSALVIIASLILWTLSKSIRPEIVKDYINAQLTALTHQNSKIEGDISWQIFPRPAIRVIDVQIGEQDKSYYAVKLDNLLFNLKITPLLRGKLVFSELNANGFQVNINPDAQLPVKFKKSLSSEQTQNHHVAEQFAIERVLLSHGQIILKQNQQITTLSNLQIGAEQFNLKKIPFPIQLKTQLAIISENKTLAKVQVNFKGSTALSTSLFNNPLLALQNTPLNGQLSLQDLKVKQIKISKVSANVKTKTGVFSLNPLTVSLYNGESVGDLAYEFASGKLTLNQTATNLNANKLLHDLLKKKLFKGSLDFSLHSQANVQRSNWHESILGKGSLTIKDGELESINLDRVIDETSKKINQLLSGKKDQVNDVLQLSQFDDPSFFRGNTAFKLLTFQYTLQNGKLQSDSLVLQTDRLQLKGDGELNLSDDSLNSHLFAKVSLTDPEVDKIQQLLGGNFPLLVKGTLKAPIVLPNLGVINPILSKFWLKETLAKPVKQIHNQIKSLLTSDNEIN